MRTSLTTFILAGVVLLLSACGQKGDLYLSDTLAQKGVQKEDAAKKAVR
ncbi:MAG: lipoprotein [Halothiobacillaceae bacterium]